MSDPCINTIQTDKYLDEIEKQERNFEIAKDMLNDDFSGVIDDLKAKCKELAGRYGLDSDDLFSEFIKEC